MPKGFSNTDHLKQGEGRARRTRASGSKFDQGEGRARSTRPSGSKYAQGEGRARSTRVSGSHLTPYPSSTDMTSDRQGGTRRGHDRTNPLAGKGKSGSKFSQHPNLTTKR